jgi:tetratricopeptide (TPR) repeat protein
MQAIDSLIELAPDTSEDHRRKVYKNVSDVCSDFAEAACNYARVLIIESGEREKTIKAAGLDGSPADRGLCGGVAGGVKYSVIKRIVFKSPQERVPDPEVKGLSFPFKDYDAAAKVAGHELKGCCNVLSVVLSDKLRIRVPLLLTIDYLGMRLVGMTHLPLGEGTLVHGSSNRRKDVQYDKDIAEDLEKVAKRLNLKAHMVQNHDGTRRFTFHTPFDLEGHRAVDGRLYILDFSRTFPPDGYSRDTSLSQLLRPELVATNPTALSSDAVMNLDDYEEVQMCTRRVAGEITALAGELCELRVDEFGDQLVYRMHQRGINLRFLGDLLEKLQFYGDAHAAEWTTRVQIEMIARSFRKIVNQKLREELVAGRTQDSRLKKVIVCQLNGLLASDSDPLVSKMTWETVERDTFKRFPGATHWIPTRCNIFSVCWGVQIFLQLVTDFLGLEWYTDAWNALQDIRTYRRSGDPVEATSIRAIVPRRKLLNIAYHSRGYYLRGQARVASKIGESISPYVLHGAIASFNLALCRQPRNVVSLRNYAQCLEDRLLLLGGETSSDAKKEQHVLAAQINDLLQQAVEIRRRDTNTLYDYAVFCDMLLGNRDKAEAHYRQAIAVRKGHTNAMFMLADLLADLALTRMYPAVAADGSQSPTSCDDKPVVVLAARPEIADALIKEAEDLYKACDILLRAHPGRKNMCSKPLNNRAIMLCEVGQVVEAGRLLVEAFRCNTKLEFWRLVQNVTEYCRVVLGDEALATSIETGLCKPRI